MEYNIALLENNSASSADLFKPEGWIHKYKTDISKTLLVTFDKYEINKTRFQTAEKKITILHIRLYI